MNEEFTEESSQEDDGEQPYESPRGMRDVISKQAARIAELEDKYEVDVGDLRERTMSQAYAAIELDPTQGTGKAVATLYDGPAAGLAEFAEAEFGYVYNGPRHPYQQSIANGYAALDRVGENAGSVPLVPDEQTRLDKAEANRDTATSMDIKGARLGRLLRPEGN